MIGDQLETDIAGARAAGCDAALLAGVSRWPALERDAFTLAPGGEVHAPVAPTWLLDKLWA